MRLHADVHCYHCGHVSGTWKWLAVQSSEYRTFQPLDNSGLPRRGVLRQVRCLRCGGPVFLDEVARPVAQAPNIFEQPHHRSCSKRWQLLAG
jgi:hypothetical protein